MVQNAFLVSWCLLRREADEPEDLLFMSYSWTQYYSTTEEDCETFDFNLV